VGSPVFVAVGEPVPVLPETEHADAHLAPAAHGRRVHRHRPVGQLLTQVPELALIGARQTSLKERQPVNEIDLRPLAFGIWHLVLGIDPRQGGRACSAIPPATTTFNESASGRTGILSLTSA